MARPIDQERRRELARAAVEVLRREGLDVSHTRLAEALGLKRPTLLYHFPDRLSIVELVLEDLLTEQARFVVQRMMAYDHPIDQLYAQVTGVHAFHDGHEERIVFLTRALAAAGEERTEGIMDIGNRVFEAHRQALAGRLRRGMEVGLVRPCDPDALVRLCRSVVDGLLVQRVMTGCELAPIHRLLWEHVLEPLKVPQGES